MLPQDYWLLPEGIEEALPDEAMRLERLRREILDLFATWGYELVIPPFIEFLDSLLTGTGHDLDLQTFKLTDQLSGRLMGVRADMTPQVARIDVHNLKRKTPTRLCYLGTVLHTRGNQLERSRNPLQVGAELYGHRGHASDLEAIRLMLEMLAIAGIQQVHIDLGHVGIYRGLARQAELNDQQESELFDILQRKASAELSELLEVYQITEPMREMLLCLPQLNGASNVLELARKRLSQADAEVMQALADLGRIAGKISSMFPALPIHFDLAELRGYHYHTGIVFAAFVPGYGREIARGGRYDEIGRIFGHARPAVGFSADLKVLARLALELEETGQRAIFAPWLEDLDLEEKIRELRAQGYRVVQELPDQTGDAAAMGCVYILEKHKTSWEVVPITI